MYGDVLKYTQLFFLWATHFGKRTLKTLLESIVLICCVRVTTADLCKVGLKMREFMGPCFKSYLFDKFDQPERIRDRAIMNLAGHHFQKLSVGREVVILSCTSYMGE